MLKTLVFYSYLGEGLGGNFGKGGARHPLKNTLANKSSFSKGKPRLFEGFGASRPACPTPQAKSLIQKITKKV